MPTSPSKIKMAEGGSMCEIERKKRELHTWAFHGRQMLRESTKQKNKVERDFIKRIKRKKERRSTGEVELVGGSR